MVKNKYSATVIGLGNIGLLYDLDKLNDSKYFLSHTKSLFFHNKFEIKFLIDNDSKKLALAKKIYGDKIIYLDSLSPSYEPTDIIVLSSIPNVNSSYLDKLKSSKKVKLFLLEKPFLNKNRKFSIYKKIVDKTYVNYFRKSLPFFKNLKKNIDTNDYGDLVAVNIYYSKGLKNNGSHLIDLMNFLFGSSFNTNSIKIINYKNDYHQEDSSVSFSVDYLYNSKFSSIVFHALDERNYSLIEIDLIFGSKRFRIFDSGGKIELYSVENDKVFSGYKNIYPHEIVDSDINLYGIHTLDTIYNILEGNEKNFSTLKEEYETQKLKEAVIVKLNNFKKNE
tara:strand:- start:84 stop:1088 length:1005 start_codon:yes stop_codon:yes gene_type:complete